MGRCASIRNLYEFRHGPPEDFGKATREVCGDIRRRDPGAIGQHLHMHGTHQPPKPSVRPRRSPKRSLGSQLERDRLEQRAARVRKVIGALRERVDAREGGAPRPLRAALDDFGRELATLERRLREVGGRS